MGICGKTPPTGSSLRVQGRHCDTRVIFMRLGFIPACAGATRSDDGAATGRRVHPCVCRGDANCQSGGPFWKGSSLRVQGRPRHAQPPLAPTRFIPACAGATLLLSCSRIAFFETVTCLHLRLSIARPETPSYSITSRFGSPIFTISIDEGSAGFFQINTMLPRGSAFHHSSNVWNTRWRVPASRSMLRKTPGCTFSITERR